MRHSALTALVATVALLLWATPALAATDYKLESISVDLSSQQAGAHADLTVGFELAEEGGVPNGFTRDLFFELPPGVIGNPQTQPLCTLAQFDRGAEDMECPVGSQVGVSEIRLAGTLNTTFIEPVYNMPSPGGDIVARFGVYAGPYPSLINIRVNPIDYSLVAAVEGAPSAAELLSARTTFWGVPAAEIHDDLRLTPKEALEHKLPPGGRDSGEPEVPFLSNPTDCTLQRELTATVVSYEAPSEPDSKTAPFPAIGGCELLEFNPTLSVRPTNSEAAAPTGLDATLRIPQNENPPPARATSTLKSAVVTLPEGMTINPAAGDGLGSCSATEVGFENTQPPRCPDSAKIGSVEIEVPALAETLKGAIYQRTPEDGKLFRFWLVTDEQGVRLKLPAEITTNLLTGQLTTVFSGIPILGGNPQVPFEELRLHVFGGPRAPLVTPSQCGTYQSHYEFAPWSGRPATVGDAPMQITTGCNKGGFSPRLSAGTLDSRAGEFSPFAMTLTRSDGEANPRELAVHLPQGLLAKLAGVPLCPDALAPSGDCPAGSQVGRLTAATGVGGAPLWVPQPGKEPTAVYLAGPYKGAPYSVVSKVPAQAGPFDLGTVVNRAGIYVDPNNATATIKTDPLPQILEGVPIAYRTIHVSVDRPNFTLNPTDCQAKEIRATLTATNGQTASPTAGFQATNCAKLPYAPKLRLALKGSTRRTGHPAVRAVLTQKPGQANTAKATVLMPTSEFIDQDHINNPCTRVQFAAEDCPPLSVLGSATATTPLLDQPLKGRVYFRSNGGERELPDIVADLRGPLRIVLVGFVDSVPVKGTELSRLRTRFQNVPDAPVTKFTMNLFGGKKKGLLENSRNLCKTNRRAELILTGQNGLVQRTKPRIATSCGKEK
ncbi:MAG TPA: hypothetical protein VLI94_00305 [Solirubrobacterales bacterium]|nr:hypothetical protein [Solirubrobacterales bacterium]